MHSAPGSPLSSLSGSLTSTDPPSDTSSYNLPPASPEYASPSSIDWHNYYQWGWDTIWDFSPPRSRYDLLPLPRSLSDRIPIEVVEAIIDYIEWQSLLRTCALVCRSWYYHSTTKLYQSITLASRIDYDRLSAVARQSPRVRARLALTRHMDIRASAHAFPLVFGKLLPSLESLVLGEGCMSPPIHRSFFLALPQLAHVTSLTIFGLEVFNSTELRGIVARFPALARLSLIDVSCKHIPARRTTAGALQPPNAMRLREVTIKDAAATILCEIIDWLTSSDRTCELVSQLAVYGSVGEGTHRLQQLLRIAGTSLTDCELNLKLGDHLDFRTNTALQTVRLVCHDPQMIHWPLLLHTLETQLPSLHSAHLRRLAFDFRTSVDTLLRLGRFPDSLDPSPVHKALAGETLARVRALSVRLSVVPGSPPVRKAPPDVRALVEDTAVAGLRAVFAPFHARGALSVEVEVYEGEPTSRFYSGASSVALGSDDDLNLESVDAGSVGAPDELLPPVPVEVLTSESVEHDALGQRET